MRGIDWTPILISVIALLGTIYTGYRSSGRKDRATVHVQRADQVVDLQSSELERLADLLDAARGREEALEDQIGELKSALDVVSGRVARLELELIRLGGDPALIM